MAAKIEGDESEFVAERAVILLFPAEMVLRPAMDEQDGRSVGFAPFPHMQLQPAAADNPMGLHRRSPRGAVAQGVQSRPAALEGPLEKPREMSHRAFDLPRTVAGAGDGGHREGDAAPSPTVAATKARTSSRK